MKRNLLIIGAGTYALVVYEIASEMNGFKIIHFMDDEKKTAPNGDAVIGTTKELEDLAGNYSDAAVAIGNPGVRLAMIRRIQRETNLNIPALVSPKAYVAPSAALGAGVVIEPMAVVHAKCRIETGCLLSAGAVVNHESVCREGAHIDCNATVPGYCVVPEKTKVDCGMVYCPAAGTLK